MRQRPSGLGLVELREVRKKAVPAAGNGARAADQLARVKHNAIFQSSFKVKVPPKQRVQEWAWGVAV